MDLALTCYLNPSGLSRVAQEYFRCMDGYGLRVVPTWIVSPEDEPADALAALDQDLASRMRRAASRPLDSGFLHLHVGMSQVSMLRGASSMVGAVVVEGNVLPPDQARAVASMDAVIVPSTFCRDVLLSSGAPRHKVHLVPYYLDSSKWNPHVLPINPSTERFRFLYMNTWWERKGYDVLLRAWWDEFSVADQVELVIKSYREVGRDEPLEVEIALMADRMGVDRNRKAPIRVIDEALRDADLPGFMRSANAFVSPHRSEGFGMNPWYAMALGVPVICTRYGGCMDFCKSDTAWLVGHGMSAPSSSEVAVFSHLAGVTWAEPDAGELGRRMRECASYPAERARRAAAGAEMVAARYDAASVLGGLQNALSSSVPGAWDGLCLSRHADALANQPSPRFESCEAPLRLAEV